MKQYDTYIDSGIEWIGKIPSHWEIVPIKYSLSIPLTDGPHETPELVSDGIPFISAEAIKEDKIDFEKKRGNISIGEHERFSKKYSPQRGDIYMIKSGATTGNLARVETDFEFNIWSPLAAFRPDTKKTTTDYLFFYMKSKRFFTAIELGWNFGTQQNIGMSVLENLRMVRPTISEQIAIGTYLNQKTTELDELIADKKRLLELYEEERISIINYAVTKGNTPDIKLKNSGVEWLGSVPEHWEMKRLKYVLSERLKYGANESAIDENPDHPRYIRITDFGNDGKLKEDTFKSLDPEKANDYLLKEGDILFARSGATVGKTFQFKNYNGIACFAGYLIKASPNANIIISDFLYYFTKSGAYENWKNSIFNQATIQNIGADKYAFLELGVPPVHEQQAIVQHIETECARLDAKKFKTQKLIELLTEYRITLISEVVTGKVKVID